MTIAPSRSTRALAVTAGLLLATIFAACSDDSASGRSLSVADVLGEENDPRYERALEPRTFEFPADHGPHPDFRSEWWYFTGNVSTPEGRRFGYHLTFFRTATSPTVAVESGSAWRTRQLWMAHFALIDVENNEVHESERFAREALDLAGADADPFRVNVAEWSVASSGSEFGPLTLRAEHDDVRLELELMPQKPIVLQGDRGLSQKSTTPGNASYYYSISRLDARGTVVTGARQHDVSGTGWFDREWSTSALDKNQVGWDWFALQLDDGRDLMFYRMRRDDGSSDPASEGVLIAADGTFERLALEDVRLKATASWTSPRSGGTYPAAFELTVASRDLSLRVAPVLEDQELDLTFRYWEGAVDVTGTSGDRPITGVGFLEMTGYADRRGR